VSIRIALFGQPRVTSADGSREFELPRKTLNVLGYLILNRARPISRDSVAFALFPDETEEKARTSLRRNLSHLLAAFPDGKHYVSADTERLAWNASSGAHVDVIAFEDAIAAGNDEAALAEYGGQLLPTLYDEWTTAERERLRDAFHEALVRTIARERSQRRFDRATSYAHRLLDEDPWREDIVRQLVAIRYEAGDRAGALAAFERFATHLRKEMQADPMPETIALRDAVLRGAPLASSERRQSSAAADAPGDVALPFVGRDADMRRARECWHSAADGRSGLLLVAGEAGAGKSRFVTELARLVESEGGSVVRGYTPAGGEYRPYEAFVEALAATPELLDDQIGATLTNDGAARLRLFDSVRRRLSESSRRRVLALVLEDLHWAGAATLDLLEFVVRRLEREPILIVATFRDDELPRAHPLRALVRQLQGRGSVTELVLERLTADDAAAAMRTALPATVDQVAIDRAIAWADGVPLLLDEATRDLAAGRTSNAADITTLVGERFARLSPQAETAIVFGAVLGERFELDTLASVTGWRDGEVIEAIGEGIDHGLLRVSSRSPGLAFAFRHDLIRVAATQRIAAPELIRAHGLIARALAGQAGDDGSRAGEIALHFFEAGEQLRAAGYYCRAARYALDVFANDDAIRVATLGLDLCDETDPTRRDLRYDLLTIRQQGLARIGASERSRADARALVSLAGDDDRAIDAVTRLFDAHLEEEAIRSEALRALQAIGATSSRASRVHAYLSARDAMARGDYTRARDAGIEAAEAFDAVGDVRAAMTARFVSLSALKLFGATADAARSIEALRPIADASDDFAMRADFHRVASSVLLDIAQPKVALEDARLALSLSLRIGDRSAEARSRQNVAVLSARSGDYHEALAQQGRAMAAFRDLGNDEGVADSILNVTAWHLFCGDSAGARASLDEFGPLERHIPLTQLKYMQCRALVSLALGNDEGAAQLAATRQRADELKASYFAARMNRELAKCAASQGHFIEAFALLEVALGAVPPGTHRQHEAETLALSARVAAALGNPNAVELAARAMECAGSDRMQAHSEIAWNAAAAYAIAGDTVTAMTLAESSAAAAVREALGMPPDLAETFLALPWHRQAVDFLWGRDVPLRWETTGKVATE
jgi:DNA-binding SARP family transcriptional activator/tetratricopeptide (TPR) repeat protein